MNSPQRLQGVVEVQEESSATRPCHRLCAPCPQRSHPAPDEGGRLQPEADPHEEQYLLWLKALAQEVWPLAGVRVQVAVRIGEVRPSGVHRVLASKLLRRRHSQFLPSLVSDLRGPPLPLFLKGASLLEALHEI